MPNHCTGYTPAYFNIARELRTPLEVKHVLSKIVYNNKQITTQLKNEVLEEVAIQRKQSCGRSITVQLIYIKLEILFGLLRTS